MNLRFIIISFSVFVIAGVFNLTKDIQVHRNSRSIASKQYDLTTAIPNKYYFTLAHDTPVRGPIYSKGESADYFKKVLGILLQKADLIASRKWYVPGQRNDFYYAFLLGSLTVPFHESYWINLRKRDNNTITTKNGNYPLCDLSANEFDKLKTKFTPEKLNSASRVTRNNASYAKWVYEFLNDHFRARFPHCSEFSEGEEVIQFLSSGGYVDMGMMQLNAKAHPNLYLDNSIFLVDKAIDYGLKYYLRGFERSYFKSNDEVTGYGCLRNETGEMNYTDLIISAWSGYYNSGPGGKACRYIDSLKCAKKVVADNKINYYGWFKWNKRDYLQILEKYSDLDISNVSLTSRMCDYTKNDMSMINDLIIMMDKQTAHFYSHLDSASDELLAVNEIIMNLKNGTNNRQALDRVLGNKYLFNHTAKKIVTEEYLITSNNANIRLAPTTESSKCGNTRYLADSIKSIRVIGRTQGYLKFVVDDQMLLNMPESRYSDPRCKEVRYLYLYGTLAKKLPVSEEKSKDEVIGGVEEVVRTTTIRIGAGIRKSLSDRSAFTGFLPVGQKVTILEEKEFKGSLWYYVDDSNGVIGWVPKFYLD